LMGEKKWIGAPYGLGSHRLASEFSEHLGVNFADRTFVRRGGSLEDGDLSPEDFAESNHETLVNFEAGSMEAKVASLDSKAQQLIGLFLRGVRHTA
jgi:hypothetical protein